MKFPGVVRKVCVTNGGLRYSVIEIKNSVHLNYSLFIPGEHFKVNQHVMVSVDVVDEKKPFKKEVKPVVVDKQKAQTVLAESFKKEDYPSATSTVVDVEPVKG
jgi:hypothetical protein